MKIISIPKFSNYPIGFSDHTEGISIPTAATALGACLIEKHFTLDKGKIGLDNQMATEPEEMKNMVKSCTRICHYFLLFIISSKFNRAIVLHFGFFNSCSWGY